MTSPNGSGNGAAPSLFRLDLGSREPFWLEVMPGVELLVEQPDARTQYAATFESLAARADIKEMVEKIQRGDDPGSAAELAEAAAVAAGARGEQTFDFILALGKRVVRDWKGVGSVGSDEPLPFTLTNLEILFHQAPEAAQAFNLRYGQRGAQVDHEKKVSESVPNGIAEAVQDTAVDAGNEEIPAPAAESEPSGSAPT